MSKNMTASDNAEKYMVELISDFSLAGAISWLRRKFDSFDFSSRTILPLGDTKNEREYFAGIERLGYVTQLAGSKNDDVNRPLLIVAVKMKKDLSERTSRLVQFNLAKKLLKDAIEHGGHSLNGLPSQGLFFFYDESGHFRISLVSGEVENKRFKFNEAKRQSFFVNPEAQNNIVRRRLFPKFTTFADVKEAFSVEALTKEFYNNLFAWYQWAMDEKTGITFPNSPETHADDRKQLSEAIIRMITRLMFVWFIKQKGIVPNALFQRDKLLELIKDFQPESMEQDNYYRVILQNLFFATLNCQPDKRKYVKSFHGMSNEQGVKTCYRCQEELVDQKAFLELMKPVPFLNCALFDCLDRQEDKKHGTPELLLDGFSSKKHRQAHVPNGLFFDEKRGLIKLFDLYEFTVDENNADDSDVALDPELLGKVFENLLGAFNPETQETARKATGSFYTPREIVDYMVEESLKNYLKTKVPAADDIRLADLFDRSKAAEGAPVQFDESETKALLDALYNCKILDPACGSGAFPMGVLHCMVRLFGRLDPRNVAQREKLMERYRSDTAALDSELSAEDRAERAETLEKQMREGQMFPDYARKLYLIENCIYGVDIQPIATQISKLRFFISLLCDQLRTSWDPDGDNYGLLSLPNLEAKFVCANTLLSLPKLSGGEFALSSGNVAELRQMLQQNRHDIFNARTAKTKAKYKDRDREIRDAIRMAVRSELTTPNQEIIAFHEKAIADALKERESVAESKMELHEERVGADLFSEGELQWVEIDVNAAKRKELDQKIANSRRIIKEEQNKVNQTGMTELDQLAAMVAGWDPYDQNACSNFFDPEWMFNVKDGFDIVIGNPPYIKEYTLKKAFDGLRKSPYYQGKMDLWYFFSCYGIDVLSTNGILCYIAQNNWVTSHGASKMRNKIISDAKICQLIDFGAYMIFGESARIQTMIMMFQKDKQIDNYTFDYRRLTKTDAMRNDAVQMFDKSQTEAVFLSPVISRTALTNKTFTFADGEKELLLDKLCDGSVFISDNDATNGIHPHYDFVNNKIAKKHKSLSVGDGIFGLSSAEKTALNLTKAEEALVKPYFTTEQIHRYYTSGDNTLWLIYTDSKFKDPNSMSPYPNLKEHLDKFEKVITSDNKPYGLHRAREERFFKGEKVIVQRKCIGHPSFSYSDFETYVSATFYIIQTSRFNLKFLTGLLNSKLIEFWLKNRGKMQGDNFQIDKEPLMQIPIKTTSAHQSQILELVDKILAEKKDSPQADTSALEAEIDKLVYQLYGLTEEEIAVVEAANTGKTAEAEPETEEKAPAKKPSTRKKSPRRTNDEYLE